MAGSKPTFSTHLRVFWCMIETFCFGGLQFGWASLVYVLKYEGFFYDGCEIANDTVGTESPSIECNTQDGQLALLYSLANGISIVPMVLCGLSISRFGAVKTRIAWICIFEIGCVLMIISGPELPWLACVGLTLLAGGGKVFLLTNIQISNFYNHGSFVVIAIIVGCFDSSSVMTLFIKLAYESGISRRVSFATILGLSLSAYGSTYVNFYKSNLENNTMETSEESRRRNEGHTKTCTLLKLYKKYVCSRLFISMSSWFILTALHFIFLIATSNEYIRRVSDNINRIESSLTNFLSIAMMTGIFPSLLVGLFLKLCQKKMTGSTQTRNLKTCTFAFLATSLTSCLLAISSMFDAKPLVYSTFILLPIFRSTLFSVSVAFISKIFPNRIVGGMFGTTDGLICLLILLQRAVFQWLLAYEEADRHIRLSFFALSVISLHHPLQLIRWIRQTKKGGRGNGLCYEVRHGLEDEFPSSKAKPTTLKTESRSVNDARETNQTSL